MGVAETIQNGYRPGLIGATVTLHMAYYAPAWGFGARFEALISAGLAAFHERYDPARDLAAAAFDADGALLGAISIDAGEAERARLRWFVVAESVQGRGLGRRLLDHALAHVDRVGLGPCALTTFEGLDAARRLYESRGFVLTAVGGPALWSSGAPREQVFVRNADPLA